MHSQASEPQAILQAWGLASPSRRGPRARVSLEEVVSVAVQIADQRGLQAVTLAAVAEAVGLTTTALYRYVDDKDVLEELVVDSALGVPPRSADDGVHDWVDALWERHVAHPWLASVTPSRAPRCPNSYAWLARLVDGLTRSGAERALSMAVSIEVLVRGYAQQALASTGEISPEITAEISRRHPVLAAPAGVQVEPRRDLHAAAERLSQQPDSGASLAAGLVALGFDASTADG